MLLNLNKYKLAKVVKRDLPNLIALTRSNIKKYEPYSRYKSVANIVRSLKEELEMMKAHLIAYNEIEKNKGKE